MNVRRRRHSASLRREREFGDGAARNNTATRVLVVDESDVIVLGIYTLACHLRLNIVGHVRDIRDVPEKVKILRPDLTIFGPYLNPQDAVTAAVETFRKMPQLKFIFATPGLQNMSEIPRSSYEILEVRTVANDFSAALKRLFPEGHKEDPAPGSRRANESALTGREREVLRHLSNGHSAKQIAFLLGISRRTVEFHKYSLMSKTGIRSLAELAIFAAVNGLH